jgi:hypothetical protein
MTVADTDAAVDAAFDAAVDAVRALLEPVGAPPPIAAAAVGTLGPDAADQLAEDPWRVLSVPGVVPAAADALARYVDSRWRADDVRRGAALVSWLLIRAADDGHTVVRASVVSSALSGYDVADASAAILAAVRRSDVVEVDGSDLALARWSRAENDAAAAVTRLLPSGLSAILGRPDGEQAAVLADADALTLEDAARTLPTDSDGTRLALSGDPDCLPAPGPGRFFADLVASGAVPVTDVRDQDGDLPRLAAAIRAGRLPAIDSPDREVVVVPARDAEDAVRRTVQLVTDSIPRVLGIPAADIQVLTPRLNGRAGVHALTRALQDPASRDDAARTVHAAVGTRWPAVVLVLPGEAAGTLSRELVYTAVTRAERHLSVVHAAGPALAVAVAAPPRGRRTGLRTLLSPKS